MVGDWTDDENDEIVANYFAMPAYGIAGALQQGPGITASCRQ